MLSTVPTIFTGAPIVTMNPAQPVAESMCVMGGRIAAIGSVEDMRRIAASMGGAKEVNLEGGTLYPGFIDTHSHLSMYAGMLHQARCGADLGSIDAVLQALDEQSRNADGWIFGYGYDDSGIKDRRHLNRHDLDKVSRHRPVFVKHISMHLAYANTCALEMMGFTARHANNPEIPYGTDGFPNGLLLENAAFRAFRMLPVPSEKETRDNILEAVHHYNRCGFTSVIDGGMGISGAYQTDMRAYLDLTRRKQLNIRIHLQFLPKVLDRLQPYGLWGLQGEFLSLGGVKCFADGSIQSHTAALLSDYHDRPRYRGKLLMPLIRLNELVLKYHRAGMQIAVHANGDAAVEAVICAIENAQAKDPRPDARHMLVHAQTASDRQLARMKACGIIPTFFARHIEVWGDRHYEAFLGPKRAERLNPAGSAARLNIPFSLHVDTPVLPVTALDSMHAAVNRISAGGRLLGAEQRISFHEALKAYTTNAALCCRCESNRGRLAPGYAADAVLLSHNPENIPPQNIKRTCVRMTICGGHVVYRAPRDSAQRQA